MDALEFRRVVSAEAPRDPIGAEVELDLERPSAERNTSSSVSRAEFSPEEVLDLVPARGRGDDARAGTGEEEPEDESREEPGLPGAVALWDRRSPVRGDRVDDAALVGRDELDAEDFREEEERVASAAVEENVTQAALLIV